MPVPGLNAEETAAIDALKDMLEGVAAVKTKHKRPALRPHAMTPAP